MQANSFFISPRLGREIAVAMLFISLGVASRFALVDLPNFKPIAALALCAGFFFSCRTLALAVPLLVMLISDLGIGLYQWQLALSVYLSLVLAGGLGIGVQSLVNRQSRPAWAGRLGLLGAASLTMSTAFFLATNGCVWLVGGWYPATWSGLVQCFVAGLPFYRWTVLGDLFFSGLIVGAWYLVAVSGPAFSKIGAHNKVVPGTFAGC